MAVFDPGSCLSPHSLVFMFTASAMPARDILRLPYPWIPDGFYWPNFWNGLKGPEDDFIFFRNALNSLIVAGSVAFFTVILSSATGYGGQVQVQRQEPGVYADHGHHDDSL